MTRRDFTLIYAALPRGARAHVSNRLRLPPCLPENFGAVLAARGYGAIDVVIALADSAAPWANAAIGTVAGRPVNRCPTRRTLPHALLRTPILVGPDALIVEQIARNPRLPTTDSFHRYALLRLGMTVQSFIKRGGTRRDVREWSREGSVVLREPGEVVTAASVLALGGRA